MDDPQPSIPGLEDQDESVRIAVKALGDMRNSGARSDINLRKRPSLSSSSSYYSSNSAPRSPPLPSPSSSSSRETPSDPSLAPASPAFVSRMSSFPLVGSAMRVYEQGKASSRVVKYGAEMVESSVKSISRPVIERLPVNVNQLDEFACRQLDRLDRYRRPSASESQLSVSPTSASRMAISPNPSAADRDRGRPKLKSRTLDGSAVADEEEEEEDGDINMTREEDYFPSSNPSSPGRTRRTWRDAERGVPGWLEATSPFIAPPPPPPSDSSYSHSHPYSNSRSSTPTQNGDDERTKSATNNTTTVTAGASATSESGTERQVAQRSRWQAVLLEAGGLSAALSEESMRRLKYCLQWLQYATAHIDAQILILRDFTASLQPLPSDSSSASHRRPPISEEHMRKLTDVRRDIVHTIRQVVDVVSKYAGGALPEPARGRVRGFILKLPQRWASKAGPVVGAGAVASAGAGASVGVERERETVAAASGTGMRRPGGQRRAAQRERGAGAEGGGLRSGQSSRATSPASSPRVGRAIVVARNSAGDSAEGGSNGVGGELKNGQISHSAALVASQRILALATESLDMMRNVTGVVKDSLDRADAWVGRLRTVGIQRGAQEGEDTDATPDGSGRSQPEEFEFTFSDRMQHRHRRTDSSQSQQSVSMYDEHEHAGSGLPSPFFSSVSGSGSTSTASTVWGSSIPSTPGGSGSGYSPGPLYNGGGAYAANASSPGMLAMTIPIGAMSLASRYGTPRSGVVGLPEEEEGEGAGEGSEVLVNVDVNRKVEEKGRKVRVVGEDGESVGDGDEEKRVQKMDVDG